MNLNKLFESVLNEVNYGTQVGRTGPRSKGPYDNKLSASLQHYDDDLAHKDLLDWDDDFFKQWDKDTNDLAWNDTRKAADDVNREIRDLVDELVKIFPDVQVTHRIKSETSARRKASDKEVGWAGLDDMVGYALVFDNQKDVEAAADWFKENPKVARIYDYSDDPAGYYAYHCALKADIGSEIQLESLRCMLFKDTIGHIFYEMLRDTNLLMDSEPNNKELADLNMKIKQAAGMAYRECYDAEGTSKKITVPSAIIDKVFSSEDKIKIINYVRPETKARAKSLLYGTIDVKKAAEEDPACAHINTKGLV